jgi:hypothetical protein
MLHRQLKKRTSIILVLKLKTKTNLGLQNFAVHVVPFRVPMIWREQTEIATFVVPKYLDILLKTRSKLYIPICRLLLDRYLIQKLFPYQHI